MANVKAARTRASELLRAHGLTSRPVDVIALANTEGVKIVHQPLGERASGLLVCDAAGTVIGVNSEHPESRQRFTIAHELAHFYLHATSPTVYIDDASVHFRVKTEDAVSFGDPDAEAEANAFAAALLMPADLLTEDLGSRPVDFMDQPTIRALASQYGVSEQALLIRLIELGLLAGIEL